MYFLYLFIFFIVFGILFGVFYSIFTSKSKADAATQLSINEAALAQIRETNFNITKMIYLNDYATSRKGLENKKFFAVDADKEKIAFVDYDNGSVCIVKFEEILNYEIYENNSLETSGGYLGGFAGVMGAETTQDCKDLSLIIRFKDINSPQINYDIINTSIGIVKSSGVYRDCVKTLQQATSFLEAIINKNKESKK